jgi:hypothetical protein
MLSLLAHSYYHNNLLPIQVRNDGIAQEFWLSAPGVQCQTFL